MKRKHESRSSYWIPSFMVMSGILAIFAFGWNLAEQQQAARSPASVEEAGVERVIEPDSTLYLSLREIGVAPLEIQHIVSAAKPYFDLSRVRPGIRYRAVAFPGPIQVLSKLVFKLSAVESLSLERDGESRWQAEVVRKQVETRWVSFTGRVTDSLWSSAAESYMDASLIAELAEIFAWQVDFEREVRVGDRWRLLVEQRWANEQMIGWGRILAAEYDNAGQVHTAVLFRQEGKDMGYFAPDGGSLKRMFLKSPIQFGRVSSRFTRHRFHPILKTSRPHLGVDYAAPKGTPVRAVGDGVVQFAGWSGGGGQTLKIRHNSTYMTAYKHLSGFAVQSGSRVRQGQVVGYVGSTGLSTGAHLHFEFYQDGVFVDPMGKKFPSAEPLPAQFMTAFQETAEKAVLYLPPWYQPGITLSGPVHVSLPGGT